LISLILKKKKMKRTIYLIGLIIALSLSSRNAEAQLIDIKPWHGYYPEMDGDYPLSFVSFKGWLFPRPHFFIRYWPTHYYMEVGALPVSDSEGYADVTRINLMKLIEKLFEKSQMKQRQEATEGTRDNTQGQKDIEATMFGSRSDELPDIYKLAEAFIRLYQSLNRLDKLKGCSWLKSLLEKDADGLLVRFISVNLLQTDHGQKLEAFSEIYRELNRQIGDADYSYRKVHFFQYYAQQDKPSFSFLAE
jgi:hypothetical protein